MCVLTNGCAIYPTKAKINFVEKILNGVEGGAAADPFEKFQIKLILAFEANNVAFLYVALFSRF